jgi:hypothetical protein
MRGRYDGVIRGRGACIPPLAFSLLYLFIPYFAALLIKSIPVNTLASPLLQPDDDSEGYSL